MDDDLRLANSKGLPFAHIRMSKGLPFAHGSVLDEA